MIAFIAVSPSPTWAITNPRLGVNTGFSTAGIQTPTVTRSDGSGGFDVIFDLPLSPWWIISGEYGRTLSLSTLASSSSITQVAAKYFFWNPVPVIQPEENTQSHYYVKTFAPYAGVGAGYMQFQFEPKINAAGVLLPTTSETGLVLSLKGGCEYMLFRTIGVRIEGSYALPLLSKYPIGYMSAMIGPMIFL